MILGIENYPKEELSKDPFTSIQRKNDEQTTHIAKNILHKKGTRLLKLHMQKSPQNHYKQNIKIVATIKLNSHPTTAK